MKEFFSKYFPYIIILIMFLTLLIGGIIVGKKIKSLQINLAGMTEEVYRERAHIDSLNRVISIKEDRIDALKDSIIIVHDLVIKEIERIDKLPLDSNVELLSANIKEHSQFTDPSDTLPAVVAIDNDSLVLLSESNVKDINVVYSEYEGCKDENVLLYGIIEQDSSIIAMKDSVIFSQDFIMSKQDSIFAVNMKDLEKKIKKDKVISGVIGGSIGAAIVATVVLGVVLGTK